MISLCKNKRIDCDLIKVARNINETMYKFVAKDFSKKLKNHAWEKNFNFWWDLQRKL